jgi:hypothetical protein
LGLFYKKEFNDSYIFVSSDSDVSEKLVKLPLLWFLVFFYGEREGVELNEDIKWASIDILSADLYIFLFELYKIYSINYERVL